jgi:hypothetical protein
MSSMTAKERAKPELINAKRKIRVAKGSGTTVQEVNKLLKMHQEMANAMKRLKKMGGFGKLGGDVRQGRAGRRARRAAPGPASASFPAAAARPSRGFGGGVQPAARFRQILKEITKCSLERKNKWQLQFVWPVAAPRSVLITASSSPTAAQPARRPLHREGRHLQSAAGQGFAPRARQARRRAHLALAVGRRPAVGPRRCASSMPPASASAPRATTRRRRAGREGQGARRGAEEAPGAEVEATPAEEAANEGESAGEPAEGSDEAAPAEGAEKA